MPLRATLLAALHTRTTKRRNSQPVLRCSPCELVMLMLMFMLMLLLMLPLTLAMLLTAVP